MQNGNGTTGWLCCDLILLSRNTTSLKTRVGKQMSTVPTGEILPCHLTHSEDMTSKRGSYTSVIDYLFGVFKLCP